MMRRCLSSSLGLFSGKAQFAQSLPAEAMGIGQPAQPVLLCGGKHPAGRWNRAVETAVVVEKGWEKAR